MSWTMLRLAAPLFLSLALALGLFAASEQVHAQGRQSIGGFSGGGGMRDFSRGPSMRDDRGRFDGGGFGPKGSRRDDDDDDDERRFRSMDGAFGEGGRKGRKGRRKQDSSSRSKPKNERETEIESRGRAEKQERDGDWGARGRRTPKPGRETAGDEDKRGRTARDKVRPPSEKTEKAATDGNPKTPRDPKRPWPSRDPKNPPKGGVATGRDVKPPLDPKRPPKGDDVATGGGPKNPWPPRDPRNPPKGDDVSTGGGPKNPWPPRDPMRPPKTGGVITGNPPSSGGGNCFDHICPDNPMPPDGGPANPTPTNDGGTPPCRGPKCPGQPDGNPTPTNDDGTPPCRGPRCPGQPDGNPTPTNDDGTPPCRGPRCNDGPDRDPPRPWPPRRPPIIVLDPVVPPPVDDPRPPYTPPAATPPVYELASPDRPRQPQQAPARQADRAPPPSASPPLPPFDAPVPQRRAFATVEQPRYRPNELLVTLQGDNPDAIAGQLAQAFNLTIQESQAFTLLADRRVYRFGIPDNRAVEGLVLAVATIPGVAQTSPNFYHFLQGAGGGGNAGWMQYALPKLRIPDTEGLVSGRGVTVAVIDSGVDTSHPALQRANIAFFDAVDGGVKTPDAHGTAITGIIAGKGDVNGIAPGAKILAIRAFAPERLGAAPVTTSMALARATDMAVARGARVVNMSFAGPRDPLLQSLIEAAYDKNVVFIAAAGNQGPSAPASYPAAYEQVIGITATDENDGLYAMANRGPYVSIAAPGVDILVPVTGQGLDYMSGTSFAAAHISGIAALLMERSPKLGPEDIRSILLNAAHDLGEAGYDEDFGAGLADAYGALIMASPNLQSSVNR